MAEGLNYFHMPFFGKSIQLLTFLNLSKKVPYLRKKRNSHRDVVTGSKELSTEKNKRRAIKYLQGSELHDFSSLFNMI